MVTSTKNESLFFSPNPHSRHLNDTIVGINWNETINNTVVENIAQKNKNQLTLFITLNGDNRLLIAVDWMSVTANAVDWPAVRD